MRDDEHRPDPDALLELARREEARQRHGKLRIYLGMCPGVGKTFAMLETAQGKKNEGLDVLAGVVETHGRLETEDLLAGLPILPRARIDYKGHALEEFDLDAALARRPGLLLVDELAHANAPGSRHPKRWQDVVELLDAGIEVWTTCNVQHLESLNDVVAQITGVRVRETVPDSIFERAESVILVDLPTDDLLQRLKEGKVYLPRQAEWAQENFFHTGNLNALRELALRYTANRVNTEVLVYRHGHAIQTTWPTAERLLVCVGPSPSSATLVRAAKRMADGLHAAWIALYIQTDQEGTDKARALGNLRLAQELGAQTHVIAGSRIAEQIIAFARQHNATRIIIGKPLPGGFLRRLTDLFKGSPVDALVRRSEEIDIHVIRGVMPTPSPPSGRRTAQPVPWQEYLYATGILGCCTLLALPAQGLTDLANIIMLYLLAVMGIAFQFSRGVCIYASALSVIAFNFFFVPPRFTFAVADGSFLITFCVMFLVAMSISGLTARLQTQARTAGKLERQTAAFGEFLRELASRRGVGKLLQATQRHLADIFACQSFVLLATETGSALQPVLLPEGRSQLSEKELGVARWVFANGKPAGLTTQTLADADSLYLPLAGAGGALGVLGVTPSREEARERLWLPDQQRLLEACARQTALALEVDRLEETAKATMVETEREKLRATLLSTVTHDFRTPLAAIAGSAETLMALEDLPATADRATLRQLLENIHHEARRLSALVDNLLRMAALESGSLTPHFVPTSLEDLVGTVIRRMEDACPNLQARLDLPGDLPALPLDAVLMEQVFVNLMENAVRHAPGSPVFIAARHRGARVHIDVCDSGPGLPPGDPERLFERFQRGDMAADTGHGLGLAICRAICKAHGGTIHARHQPEGGTCFRIELPLKENPA